VSLRPSWRERPVAWRLAREHAAVLVGLALLPLFLFRPAILDGQVLFIRDIGTVWYPQVESFVRCIAAGSWPLWDAYRGFGQPLLADPGAQVLYPLTWLNLLLRPWHYYTLFAVFHLIVSSLGTYLLARRWGGSPAAAFLAAAVWCLSGPLLSFVSLWHHFTGAAWIPWLLLAADRALSSGKTSHALAWGALLALQILAGSADMVVIAGVAVLAHALSAHVRWRAPAAEANWRLGRSTLIAGVVAAGLSAALWLPALALARESLRWQLPLADRTTWSLHPAALLGLLCQVNWGGLPRLTADAGSLRDLQAPFLYSVYLGAPTAGFVAAALASGATRAAFLACLGLGSLLMALGRYAGVYGTATLLLPALQILRFPVKWMILVALAWSLLAGLGYDAWRAPGRRTDVGWSLGVLAPLALAATALLLASAAVGRRPGLSGLTGPLLVGGGLLGVTALLALARRFSTSAAWAPTVGLAVLALGELTLRQQRIQHFAPRELFTHRPAVLDLLREPGTWRLYVYDYSAVAYGGQDQHRAGWGYVLASAPEGFSRPAAIALGVQMYLNPPTAGRWGLYGSYDVDLLGLAPEPLTQLVKLLRRSEQDTTHLRLLRLGGVAYVLALHREPWWDDLAPVGSRPGLFQQPIQVLRVPDPLPRARLVGAARIADGDGALALLADPGFDPAREVILAGGVARDAPGFSGGDARITRLDPDRVQVEVDAPQAAYLVLADAFQPGWRARVDGSEVELLRANVAFRAVAVPAGRHQVDFHYRPTEVWLGSVASAGTALATLGYAMARSLSA
jgi:hypothetical protein